MKIRGPLLSQGAHGSVADIITFSKKRTGQQARKHNKPLAVPSGAQRAQRRLTEFLVAQWQNMSAGDKATWEVSARRSIHMLSGYHYFLRKAQRDLYTHTGLCGYWHCNEIIAGKVLDLSGKGNHGTLEPTYPSDAPTVAYSKSARFSKALDYNGTSDYVDCGNAQNLNLTTKLTIEMLFLWRGGIGTILARNLTGYIDRQYAMVIHTTNNRAQFTLQGTALAPSAPNSIQTNKWYWVTGAWDKDEGFARCFLNGELSGTPLARSAPLSPGDLTLSIGRRKPNHYLFDGIIDEVCIYNRALSAGEIATRYKFATAKI